MAFHGHLIKELRKAKGWGVDQIAAESGMAQSTVTAMETGITTSPRKSTISKLAAVLDVPESYFYTDDKGLPSEYLPPLPEEARRLVMDPAGTPYIIAAAIAKSRGISAKKLQDAVDLLTPEKENNK